MANTPLKNFTDLDFDVNRESLKQFLKKQDRLSDYDFDGSNLSVLIDLLAFSAQHYSFMANMSASEKMLSLAQRRISVVEGAKNQGYTPRSARCARAVVSFDIEASQDYDENTITLPANTQFSAKVNDESYTFLTDQDYIANRNDDGTYRVDQINIFEGRKFTFRQTIAANEKTVIIPNKGADITRLSVIVKDSTDASGEEYQLLDNFIKLDRNSKVYFVEEIENELYRIRFGDGVIGKSVENGNVIEITYFVSSGEEPNGLRDFTMTGSIANISQLRNFVVLEPAFGGDDIEDIDSVRFRGPRSYEKQNRACTPPDYIDSVKEIYSNAKDVNAWGGEDNVPPLYGTNVVSIIPVVKEYLTTAQKNEIKLRLEREYGFMGLSVLVADPDYIFLRPSITVNYDSTRQNLGANNLKSKVRQKVKDFGNKHLNQFNSVFRYSRFGGEIDGSDTSVISNEVDIEIYYEPLDINDVRANGGFTYNEQLEPNTFRSGRFTYRNKENCAIVDDGKGKLNLIRINTDGGISETIKESIGTVNYDVGSIEIDFSQFITADIYTNDEPFRFHVKPTRLDITPVKNQVLSIRDSDVSIQARDIVTGRVV